jgi:hypothetical protein
MDRYDYSSRSCRFILRMPSSTHEFFRSKIVSEILRQLGTITNKAGEIAEFASAVQYAGSPMLQLLADEASADRQDNSWARQEEEDKGEQTSLKYDAHEPDAAFKHINAQWPGIVIEVSFSQKKKELKYLAEDYILGSDGNIQVVIGIDIEYKQSKKATFSV